jgi:hypothetical protein
MMPEGDEPPRERPLQAGERDVLAERRAARRAVGGDSLTRRAEAAEATVGTLESHLADLRQRLLEAERERERAAGQLAEREHELRRVKQREYAEQQLRVEAEEGFMRLRRGQRAELDRLQRRLHEARASAQHAEEQRAQAEQQRAELTTQLAGVNESCARLQRSVSTLQRAALELRETLERDREAAHTRIRELERALLAAPRPECEEARREEMASALAAAVERLRARVAAVAEQPAAEEPLGEGLATADQVPSAAAASPQTPPAEAVVAEVEAQATEAQATEPASSPPEAPPTPVAVPQPELPTPVAMLQPELPTPVAMLQPEPPAPERAPAGWIVPRLLPEPNQRESWLAPAIRRVAERRDGRLAGELVAELLPALRLVVKRPLTCRLAIAELDGPLQVRVGGGQVDVGRSTLAAGGQRSVQLRSAAAMRSLPEGVDFLIEGRAADFAELAAGGAGRRLPGLALRGSRRRARALRRARRRPLALWDLAVAGIDVWPGLLLLALAEAIDPRWTAGQSFTLAFAIEGCSSAMLYVEVRDGEPLAVTRTSELEVAATARLSERVFTCMFAGAPLPVGERVLLEGDPGALERLIEWADRAQGLRRSAA